MIPQGDCPSGARHDVATWTPRLSDLFRDAGTGQLSQTKLWANVAYAAATAAFLKQAWAGTLTPDVWLFYLGIVGAHTVVSKLISMRYGAAAGAEK